MRLRQTAGLLEWMARNTPDPEAVGRALEAVDAAALSIAGMRIHAGAAEAPSGADTSPN